LLLCNAVAAQFKDQKLPDGLPAHRFDPVIAIPPATGNRQQTGQTCNTNTFYLHLPAPAGEQIQLSRFLT